MHYELVTSAPEWLVVDHYDRLCDDASVLSIFAFGLFHRSKIMRKPQRDSLWNTHIKRLVNSSDSFNRWVTLPRLAGNDPVDYPIRRQALLWGMSKLELERVLARRTYVFNGVVLSYVYLMATQDRHPIYKIGRSYCPAQRLYAIRSTCPVPVELLCTIPTHFSSKFELMLHARFADKRVNGEWFELTDEDVAYIKALAEASNE